MSDFLKPSVVVGFVSLLLVLVGLGFLDPSSGDSVAVGTQFMSGVQRLVTFCKELVEGAVNTTSGFAQFLENLWNLIKDGFLTLL